MAKEEDQRVERLFLGRYRDATSDRKPGKKLAHLLAGSSSHAALLCQEMVEPPGPVPVGLLGAPGIMQQAQSLDEFLLPLYGAQVGPAQARDPVGARREGGAPLKGSVVVR